MTVKVVFYGDDFTGATDNCAQYHRHGAKALLFFAEPGEAALLQAARERDVIGVAGTTRSLATADMAAELEPILARLKPLGAPLVQYKCCSTFDSSASVGSLGEAARLMRAHWPGSFVPVLAATPEFGRYTAFGQHFARFGNDVFRLDRHPTMSRHPVTPMHEADLGRIMREQGFDVTRLVDLRELDAREGDAAALAANLLGSDSAVFDSFTATQLTTAAAAIWAIAQHRPVTAVAAQGLAYGLGLHFRASGLLGAVAPSHHLASIDRLLVLSGSCSPQSAAQIAWAERNGFHGLRLSPQALLEDNHPDLLAAERQIVEQLAAGRSVIAYTASGPDDPAIGALRARLAAASSAGRDLTGPAYLAERVGAIFARLGRSAIERAGLRRLVVAGGDSSSFAMRRMGADALEIQASHFVQNAHVGRLYAPGDSAIHGIEVLLKGGQVGTEDLYGIMLDGF
jgi:uncharacterized protein YgbK (DUF1537 family)